MKTNFLINGPKPELYRCYIDDCFGATSSTREELNQFITAVNSFYPALKYTWEISDTSLAFLDIKVSIEGDGYALACTTNPQILIVICIHLHIHHMSRIPFLILSFLDFVVFVVTKIRGNMQFFQQTWLSCFCCSSGPSSRTTNRSTVSTTNVTKRGQRENSIHSHISPSQPRSEINHSKKLQITSK